MAPVTGCEGATFMIYCKKQDSNNGVYCVTERNGKVVLAPPNMGDLSQMWEKEDTGNGYYMLVNKATNKVVKFYGKSEQLIMVNKPLTVDKSVWWADGVQDYCGYTHIRAPALLDMVMDAWCNTVYDGSVVTIYTKNNPDSNNQLWKLVPV